MFERAEETACPLPIRATEDPLADPDDELEEVERRCRLVVNYSE